MMASERAAMVAYLVASGRRLSTRDVARLTECSLRTAQRTMCVVERVIPISPVEGRWQLVRLREDASDTDAGTR